MNGTAAQAKAALQAFGDPKRAAFMPNFMKTIDGYGDPKDRFTGGSVPDTRKVAKQFRDMSLSQVGVLLRSHVHEHRLCALIILVHQYERGDAKARQTVFDLYLSVIDRVNNWDLVDASAHKIVGPHLLASGDSSLLDELAASDHLWSRRVAMVATLAFIKADQLDVPLRIAERLLHDEHDLMHKAVGWMLRELGKRDEKTLVKFLKPRYKTMPRTMLRYSIERFEESRRRKYLKGEM